MTAFTAVVAIDPGEDSAIAQYSPTADPRVRAFPKIESRWLPERARADLVLDFDPSLNALIVIEDGAHFPSQQSARGFERSQCKWIGALRLLGLDPLFVNVSSWHAQLRLQVIASEIDTSRAFSGLPKLPSGTRLKSAVANFLKNQIGYVARTHNEADALAMAVAVHRGLTTNELGVEGNSGRRQIVRSGKSRGRASGARKRASR